MKRTPQLLLVLFIGISLGLFFVWHRNVVDILVSQSQIQKDSLEIHEKQNAILKKRSIEYSPDGKKIAYFRNKFVSDIKGIGDPNYVSLIIEYDHKTETVFRGNFHISHFEWLDDNEIKVYKGCGSSCLLSYIVDINSKQSKESVEKIFY